MSLLRKISLWLNVMLYTGAGINHFWHPLPYYSIIPPYLPYHHLINLTAGIAELTLAILLIFPISRKFAAMAIALMLVLFIPVHVYMITQGGCMGPKPAICISLGAAWVRLIPLQFILIWWALSLRPRKNTFADSQ